MTTTLAAPAAAPPAPRLDPRRWKALALLAVADFVTVLDATIVNIALPQIGRDLHASTSALSWVISAYILGFGALLPLGGRLADVFGRRRLFMIGLFVFGAASLAGGLSTSIGELIAFRAIQGAGAAMLAPAARSIVQVLFSEGAERSKAMGIWAAVAGSGSVVGLIAGGVLTSSLGWQWVLWVNVPVTLGALLVTRRLIDESRAQLANRTIDWLGAALVAGGMVAVLTALVDANNTGWTSVRTIGLLTAGSLLLALFGWVESRVRVPLVRLGMFRLPYVRSANLVMVAMAAAMVGMFFILSLYQQQLQGYSALKAGMSQLPLGAVLVAVAGSAGPLIERFGARNTLTGGLAAFTGGIGWLSRVPAHGSFLANILGPSLLIGTGLGLAFVALTVASTTGVSDDEAGVAGGLINSTQQLGGALGLAILTAVATRGTHSQIASVTELTNGFRMALLVATAISAVGTIAAAAMMPRHPRNSR
jgi:EmrB/QacA subfamily drug resistance transporter